MEITRFQTKDIVTEYSSLNTMKNKVELRQGEDGRQGEKMKTKR